MEPTECAVLSGGKVGTHKLQVSCGVLQPILIKRAVHEKGTVRLPNFLLVPIYQHPWSYVTQCPAPSPFYVYVPPSRPFGIASDVGTSHVVHVHNGHNGNAFPSSRDVSPTSVAKQLAELDLPRVCPHYHVNIAHCRNSEDVRCVGQRMRKGAMCHGRVVFKSVTRTRVQDLSLGSVPPLLDVNVVDEIFKVSSEQGIQTARAMARKEVRAMLFGGMSIYLCGSIKSDHR